MSEKQESTSEQKEMSLENLHTTLQRISDRLKFIESEAKDRITYARNGLGNVMNAIRQSIDENIPWDKDHMVLSELEFLGRTLFSEVKALNELYVEKKKLICIYKLLTNGGKDHLGERLSCSEQGDAK